MKPCTKQHQWEAESHCLDCGIVKRLWKKQKDDERREKAKLRMRRKARE